MNADHDTESPKGAATSAASFVWDHDYNNNEQVRPYLPAFLKLHAEIERQTGRGIVSTTAFKGAIPEIVGPDEDAAIFLLQNLRELDRLDEDIKEFLAHGGSRLADAGLEDGQTYRGTVVSYGFHSDGTGWRQYDKTRFVVRHRETPRGVMPYVHVYLPRKRKPIEINRDRILVRTTN